MNLVPGQGHFGPDAIPGVSSSHIQTIALFPCTFTTQLQSRFRCAEQRIPHPWQDARWRRGESVSLKTARETMVPLEMSQHGR